MSSEEEVGKEASEQVVQEIAASSIRSGLAELELKTSQVLQRLENVKTQSASEINQSNSNFNSPTKTGNGRTTVTDGVMATASGPNQVSLGNSSLLDNDRKAPSEILKTLEAIVSYTDSPDEDPEFPLPALDDVSHLALISHSIVAYLTHLDHQHLLRVTNNIAGDTQRWLGTLFRFLDPASSFHSDDADAILRAVRLAIVSRCPGYLEGGIPALANPCFYISENTTPLRLQYACRQLGIPLEAIRLIKANKTFGTMDLSLLQKQVQQDIASNRTPLLVVADIGASICGYVDNLLRMRDICKTHNMWLHATGHGLAALACAQGSGTISDIVDSIVLNLGSWLGVPSLPIVLIHRPLKNAALTAFESDPILSRRLNALSLWASLQALGRESISERIHVAFQTCSILFEITSKCEGICVVSRAPGAQSGNTLADIINKPLDANLLFETAAPVVVFQFDGSSSIPPTTTTITKLNDNNEAGGGVLDVKPLEKVANPSYFDRLNSWLGQILQRDCPNLDLEIIEHQAHGTCIRYCPFEMGLGQQPPTAENLENFAQDLETHVDILRATIKHKATFIKLVENSSVLRLVNLPEWAGMGGVRFVPEGWESILTDQARNELNKLNIDLVDSLKSTDNAFSLGEGTDGLTCVRFGMVTHETDVEELLELVVSVGKTVQENSRVLDTMSEIVKKGIETATADLQRESEEKLWQEGILRHVPVVGRVFNWWSPPAKESGIKGRSLNLTQGVVESTENIYKYHMQLPGHIHGGKLQAKSQPNAEVQTPLVSSTTPNAQQTTTDATNSAQTTPEKLSTTAIATTTTTAAAAAVASGATPNVSLKDNNSKSIVNNVNVNVNAVPGPINGVSGGDGGDNNASGNPLGRSVSQSSAASSSTVPELVAVNNAINTN